jgi:hypothetical protein
MKTIVFWDVASCSLLNTYTDARGHVPEDSFLENTLHYLGEKNLFKFGCFEKYNKTVFNIYVNLVLK